MFSTTYKWQQLHQITTFNNQPPTSSHPDTSYINCDSKHKFQTFDVKNIAFQVTQSLICVKFYGFFFFQDKEINKGKGWVCPY